MLNLPSISDSMSNEQIEKLKMLQSKVNESNIISNSVIEDNSFIRVEKKEIEVSDKHNNKTIKEDNLNNKNDINEKSNNIINSNVHPQNLQNLTSSSNSNFIHNNLSSGVFVGIGGNQYLNPVNNSFINNSVNSYNSINNHINYNSSHSFNNVNNNMYGNTNNNTNILTNNESVKSFSQIIHENYMKSKNEIKKDEFDEILGMENNFKPVEEIICYVCSRKFQSKEKLKVHEEKSNLHKVILFVKI